MIDINDKKDCCGCSACEQCCPKNCIIFEMDSEVFLYPSVDMNRCIDCGLCERVCPVINQNQESKPLLTLAARNKDDIVRKESSSGGVFTAISEYVLNRGGIVYGASFDKDWSVRHIRVSSIRDLTKLRGSKYVQSCLGDSFKRVKADLTNGIEVVFSGTPCQVAGLKNYLRKDYQNLITVDTVCHGVPSPGIWSSYLDGLHIDRSQIASVSMRAKPEGWKQYRVQLTAINGDYLINQPFYDNHYMMAFLRDYSIRPSCFDCPTKSGRSGSDITLGDFWGIETVDSSIDDNKGLNLLLINTEKGRKLIEVLGIVCKKEQYEDALKFNQCIENSVTLPKYRKLFIKCFEKKGFNSAYNLLFSKKLLTRIYRKVWFRFN